MLSSRIAFRYTIAGQAIVYAGCGVAVFRKTNGRLPWPVRILLAPYMICARITLHYYCRSLALYAQAAPGVWLGRRLTDPQAREAIGKGVNRGPRPDRRISQNQRPARPARLQYSTAAEQFAAGLPQVSTRQL